MYPFFIAHIRLRFKELIVNLKWFGFCFAPVHQIFTQSHENIGLLQIYRLSVAMLVLSWFVIEVNLSYFGLVCSIFLAYIVTEEGGLI